MLARDFHVVKAHPLGAGSAPRARDLPRPKHALAANQLEPGTRLEPGTAQLL